VPKARVGDVLLRWLVGMGWRERLEEMPDVMRRMRSSSSGTFGVVCVPSAVRA
jgi:hypothetical protein